MLNQNYRNTSTMFWQWHLKRSYLILSHPPPCHQIFYYFFIFRKTNKLHLEDTSTHNFITRKVYHELDSLENYNYISNIRFITLYWTRTSLSFKVSRTMLPFSSSTMITSSGLAIRQIMSNLNFDIIPTYICRLCKSCEPMPSTILGSKFICIYVRDELFLQRN